MALKGAVTSASLSEGAEAYFRKRRGKSVSVAGLCSDLGISLEEWYELGKRKALNRTVRRIETKVRAVVENDVARPATITSLLLKQLADDDRPRVEFVLKIRK